jgi:hypothetical protein
MNVQIAEVGTADALTRVPPGTQRDGRLIPADDDTVRAFIAHLKLPSSVATLYVCKGSLENEFYLGSFTFRSLSSMMRDATNEAYERITLAVSYATAREPRRYVYDPVDDTVTQELHDTIEEVVHVDDLVQRALADARTQVWRLDEAYRDKCIHGRFVPSPELHPPVEDDLCS